MADPKAQSWFLEVVRGATVGRRFTLAGGETILGNAPGDPASINLADQEGNAPRRMAARQAKIELRNGTPVVADLESPGGTFVNRRRVLPGKGTPLEPDDVIQLGGVQLRVVAAGQAVAKPSPPPTTPTPPRSDPKRPFVVALAFGSTCRSWDDFLAISAQKWTELRQELTSGRLAGTLASQGLSAFAPDPNAPGSPDDRLDSWLGSLPTAKSAAPELAIHPKTLQVRASAEGSVVERIVTITNTGYRILRGSATIDPADCSWLRIEPAGPFAVADELRLRVIVTTPIVMTEAMAAALVIDTNGGKGRVAVTLERPGKPDDPFQGESRDSPRAGSGLFDPLASISATKRLGSGIAAGVVVGGLLLLIGQVWPLASDAATPSLMAAAIVFALLGAVGGVTLVTQRGAAADLPAGIGSGAVAGVMAAALVVAIGREITLFMGQGAGSLAGWAVVGAALAALSLVLAPCRTQEEAKG
jgi:hypothetical protein